MSNSSDHRVGDPVELFTAFNGRWSAGFEVAEVLPDGYRVRRLSDGGLLPPTGPADLRRPPPGPRLR